MKIDYKNYVVFPYTYEYLRKKYSSDVLNEWGDQLAFLCQNGYSFTCSNSLESISEQMHLFNEFQNYDDFENLKNLWNDKTIEDPTKEGYKMVDSVLDIIINKSAWALNRFIDIKSASLSYKDTIEKMVFFLGLIVDSDDVLIKNVANKMFDEGTLSNIEKCYDFIDDERYIPLLLTYQKLYEQVLEIHKKIYRMLLTNGDKGKGIRMSNINDEIYGSSGGFNPNDKSIKCRNGSALFTLKNLTDKNISDADLRIKMLVLAQDCVKDGETDKIIVRFAKGDNSNLSKVRKVLTEIVLNGIIVLLCLKHSLTLIENDNLNEGRAQRIAYELSAICDYVGLAEIDLEKA